MSIESSSMKLSKEMSVEESYSKTSVSSSSKMLSSRMESTESMTSSSALRDSNLESMMLRSADDDASALVSKLESGLSLAESTLTGSKMSSVEKSSSVMQSESSVSYQKSEISSSVEESSQSISMKKEESIKQSSEEIIQSGIASSTYSVSETSEEKDLPIYVVIMDYKPRENDFEGLRAKEGQEVEVIDSSKAHKWRVRLKKNNLEGTIPSCYLEKKTDAATAAATAETVPMDPKVQATLARREKVLKELVESEEAFARDMQFVVNNYLKEMDSKQMPKELRDYKDALFTNFKAISEFHNNVLMKGIQYYINEPERIGKTFLRLERDFDMHVQYCKNEPEAQQLLITGELRDYFESFSKKIQDEKTLSEHLKLPIQRLNDYQLLLKELIKYTARLREDTTDLEKAHDFMQAIPQRIADLQYLNSIQGYKGNLHKLGRILKHDWFEVHEPSGMKRERFLFLFKGRIFITDHKRVGTNKSIFLVKHVIKLLDVEIVDNADDDDLKMRFQSLKKGQAGYPLSIKAKTIDQKEEWLKEIQITSTPQGVEDLGDDEFEPLPEEQPKKSDIIEVAERNGAKVEIIEDFEAYEEMHTVVTESVRSGSLTSLEDFHSALEDEPSLCLTASEADTGGPGRPLFIKPLRAVSCAEGAEAILECEICSSPEATVAWLKDNSPFHATQKAIIESDGGKHRLIVKQAGASDSGLYTIIASNVNGTVSCSAPLAVHSAPETLPPTTPDGTPMHYGPIFLEKLKDMELQEGTEFRVCVVVQGEPQPNVKFYKDDVEIKVSGRVRAVQESKECYELIIDKVMAGDAGKYSCVASSTCGENITSCSVTVTGPKEVFVEPGSTTPEITDDQIWQKDGPIGGKDVESSERFKVEIDEAEDTVSLVFQHVTPGDAGMYTCVASTSGGKISCSAELTVQGGLPREPEAPKASASTNEVVAKAGSSALLELNATGFPKPKIIWSKDGEELKAGEKYAMLQEDEEAFTIAIKNLTPEDSGKYSVLAKNELGESEVDYKLTVTSPPSFTKPMKDTKAKIDEDAKFEVDVSGSPEPSVQWSKDGQVLAEDNHVKLEEDGSTKRLIIKTVKPDDAGNYSCTLKNSEGTQAGFGSLQVISPPKFVQGLKDVSAAAGQDVSLKVKLAGTPKPELQWLKDGSQVKPDGSHIISKEESSGCHSLMIKKTTDKDSGEYTCKISNEHGSDETKAKVTISDKPNILKLLEDKTVTLGEKNIDLSVQVAPTPGLKIRWFIGDMEIKESSKYESKSDEDSGLYSLKIKEVTSETGGKYTCKASNDSGETATSSTVTVKESEVKKSEEKSPSFTQGLKDKSVEEGSDVEFTVKFAGEPKPTVAWSKDGSELAIDGKHFELKKDDAEDSLKLILHEATKDDSGKYTVTIKNSSGSETTSSIVTVTEKTEGAKFTKGLKDVKVTEGEDVEFTVTFHGKPKPDAKWTKDGADLKIDGKHFEYKKEEAEDSLTIILHKAAKEDAGKYSCKITNSSGSDTTSSEVTVTEKTEKVKITKGLKDVSVTEDENVEFTVKFQGKPKPTAKWTKDGADLKIDNKHFVYKKEEADDSLTLVLNKAEKGDSGKYSCVLTNSSGSDESSCEVKVTESTEAVKIVKGLTDITVKEDEEVELTVRFKGKPKPTAKWTKDGAELKIDNKHFEYKKEEAEDSLTLVLHKATKDDSGKYGCTLTNSSGSDETNCEVKVTEKTEAAKFVKGLKDVSIKEEEDIEFTVKFQGKPKPTAKWTKDGAELKIDGKHFEYKKEEAEDSLTIILHKANENDGGKYSCKITNSEGSDETSCEVKVAKKEKAPKFVQGLKDMTVKEEQTVKFTVKIDGHPKPSAKWTKNDAELTIDGKHIEYKVEEAENSLTIILHNATKDDAGKYTCTISNSVGSESTSSKLVVTDTEFSPEFTEGLKDKDVKKGETINLKVKFTGKPTPKVEWSFDGSEVIPDGKHIELKSAEGEETLIIRDAVLEDVGKYSCVISNSCGKAKTSGKLTVLVTPAILKGLEDTEGEMSGTVRLNVKFEGYPEPTATWKKDGSPITMDGAHFKVAIDGDDSLTLVIKNVTAEDAASYTCELKNPLGCVSTSGKLTVSGKPVIKIPLENKEALSSQKDVEFCAEVKATPAPDITWMLNGKDITNDDRFKVESDKDKGVYKLIIKEVTPDIAGDYTLKAKNTSGTADTSAKLKVLEKPKFVKDLSDISTLEDEEVCFETQVKGNPRPVVTWFKDKKEISSADDRFQKIEDGELCKLIIKNCQVVDSGSFTCKAKNSVGDASQTAKLIVKSKKDTQGPVFLTHLYDQVIVVGDAVKFEAKITGKPQPKATWYRNNEEIKPSDEIIIKSEEQTYSLVLKNLKLSDSDTYKCEAVNEYGKVAETSVLTVKEPVAPKIEGIENIEVNYGSPVRIKTKVSGFPIPEVTWMKDGNVIKSTDSTYQVTEDAQANKHAVSISSVKESNVGEFTCLAKNSAGSDEATCTLSIKAQAPVFSRELKDLAVDIDDSFKFSAEIYGYPTPSITWLKDKTDITNDNHYVAAYKEGVASLQADKAVAKDAGSYVCKASNSAGEATSRANLKIQDFAPKVLDKLPSNMKLVEGDKLHMKAKVLGQPMPQLKWVKDGKPLKLSNRVRSEVSPDGAAELFIDDVTHDDAGNYKLVATNDKGHSATDCDVDVQFKAKASKPFVEQLHPVDLIAGNPLKLEAKVTGNPKPEISWLKDANPLEAHVKVSETPEGHAVLSIERAADSDSGEYQVKVTNELGEDSSIAKVTVTAPGKKPAIVKELKPARFFEGEPGKLEAVISGQPLPTITWMHNGKNVMEGKHCTVQLDPSGLATLTFPCVAKEDGGLYTLVAANKSGKVMTEAPVIVVPATKKEEEKKPKKYLDFVQSLMPQLVPEGRPFKLEAEVTTDPKPIAVKWCKDGKELSAGDNIEISQDLDTGKLKLSVKQMTSDDRGKYCVVVTDGHIEAKSEALVNMIPAMPGMSGNKPYFIRGLEPVTLNEGETLKLQAALPPDCKCTIKWMKDGEDIVPGNRITRVQQPDGSFSLIIENVTNEDAGKYVVIACNEEGKTRSSALVAVVGDGFRLPEIKEALQPAQFTEGQPASLKAKVDGEPKPDVKWLHNGQPLEPSERVHMSHLPDGTVKLDFDTVKPDDAGKYTVVISNVGGETRSSAPVDVKRPPLFVKPLADTVVVEGFPSKLECKVTGEPKPNITWKKDGTELPKDDSHKRIVSMPDGTNSLVFDKCCPDDAGCYSCTASNVHGEKSSEANVRVIGKDKAGEPNSPPKFLTPLSDVTVADGDSFKLEATVSGNPLPNVAWYLDDQPAPISDRTALLFDGKRVSYSVYGCNRQYGGVYECRLTNSSGDASSKGKVSVLANKAPSFIERLYDAQFSTDKPMKLCCRVEGVPDPNVEWYFNGSKLENGLKYNISREGDKCLLVLPKPRGKDSGIYECRAKNVAGSDSCKGNMTVSGTDTEGEPAVFLKKLRDTEVLSGMTAKFTACIMGVPRPDIKWFKDGEQMAPDSRRTFEVDPNGVIRFFIRNAQRSDAGSYRCSISNLFGSDTCTCVLIVEGKDKDTADKGALPQKVEKTTRAGPPTPLPHPPYIFKMDDTSISLGWRPYIPLHPQVPSTYRLEMRCLPDGDWSLYKSGIKDSSCDIRDLIPGKDYEFRVRVENKFGISEPSPYITARRTIFRPPTPGDYVPKDYEIEHPPLEKIAAAPRFLRREEDEMYAVKGQPARIEFWVYGCPQPKITWFFNNVQVEPGKYDFLEDRNGQVILFISRMGEADVGTYLCKAVNEHGEAQQKIKVLIAEHPIFTHRLAPTTILIRKGAEFTCKVFGVPEPKIRWFKDFHPLCESSRIKIYFISPDTCTLKLSDSILKDSGLYTCSATNVAGSATTSAMLTVEECEQNFGISTYRRPSFVKSSNKPFEDHYDIGEELGRGTQGITYHAVDRSTGKSYAAKVMHGTGPLQNFMAAEMDIMSQLCHPRLVRLWNAHETKSSLTLATDLCGGGELLPHILQHSVLTESLVAQYIKQVLEGLQHMHEKNIAHLGLTVGDLLVTRVNSDSIKIGDFGLATRLYSGRDYIQEYGHPEYVAPEVANKQPVTLAADMWSVGIITYLLLTGSSPFLRENDRETLKEVQKGRVDFYHDGFVVLSDEAKDFVTQLLTIEPNNRMDVSAALQHKWLNLTRIPDMCDELNNADRLRDYEKRWRSWYANASCKRYYRRRPLESCFTHPSRMIYPPDETYTPPSTPERELGRSRVKPSAFDDVTFQQKIEREPIDVRSESHYQNGPDTFLLPLRDPDFPVRIRRYLKVGANRSPMLARHLRDKHWGYSDVAVKERRKFVDVMDEEIDDEKKGVSRSAPLRLRHEVGTLGSGYDHLECKALRKKRGFRTPAGSAPFFREKIRDAVIRENEDAVFTCLVASETETHFSWFRNDGILIESSRIEIKKWSDGRCTLTLKPAKAYDVGVYKCVARNDNGVSVCRARLNIGSVPGRPDPPKAEKCSDTEIYVTWLPPKFEGHCPSLGYALELREENDENWTKLASNISHEFFLVKNLNPTTTYFFRVSAFNRFGWGEFSLSSEPALTLGEASPKIELSRAQKYQQDMTESGQPLLLDEDEEHVKMDYSVEETPIEMEEGDPLELYNFISEIARGRFSLVQKVWVRKINAAQVVKACHLTDQTSEAVMREFEMYKSLQHERIARLISACSSKNSMFLVMEKLSGIDVLTYLSSRPLYSEETVSRIIRQVIDGLEYLHFRSICYFELQPDNVVMVDRHNLEIKLVDFGSAQYVPDEGAKIEVKGSAEYLAPEVLKGEDVCSSADIWGVGVLTYILLSGVSPFAGESELETKNNVLYVRYHFDHLYKEVSQEATHFLMQVFKRTPQKRPTAAECLENKWLLPNEYMIKKREHTVFLPHHMQEFSEQFHSAKSQKTPPFLLNMFGKSSSE